MSELRVGVTGSGFMGRTHVDALRRVEHADVVAVAGGRRAPQLAADYGIDCAESIEQLIRRTDLDAIVVATPHHCHVQETLLAAEHGKHVLVEKPLATRLEDCRQMIDACRSSNLVLAVGYHQRFRDCNRRMRELIQDGAIGAVRCIQSSALFDITKMRDDSGFGGDWGWWKDPRSLAHLINSAPHNVDLCRWWLGAEVESAAAVCGTFREPDNPNENTTMALLTLSTGAAFSFWSSSVAPAPGFPGEDFRFRIMGDEGLIDVNPFDELRIVRDGEWQTEFKQPPVGHDDSNAAYGMPRMQAYTDQMQSFVDAIRGEPGEHGTAEDGFAGVASVLAMLESSRSGTTVAVERLG